MKIASSICILLSSSNLVKGFSPITSSTTSSVRRGAVSALHAEKEIGSFDPLNLSPSTTLEEEISNDSTLSRTGIVSLAALLALTPEAANAAPSPDWGLFEGKTGSLLHPVIMASMFALSFSTALKGFQYRRQRTMGGEISALKKTLPDLGGEPTLAAAIAAAQAAEDSALVAKYQSAMPIQQEIDALTAERKDLSSKGLKDGHFSQGATLAFLGTAFAIEVRLYDFLLVFIVISFPSIGISRSMIVVKILLEQQKMMFVYHHLYKFLLFHGSVYLTCQTYTHPRLE